VNAIATALGSHNLLALDKAIDPTVPNEPGGPGNGTGGKFPVGLARVTKTDRGAQISVDGST
jgi:hypothetical protein